MLSKSGSDLMTEWSNAHGDKQAAAQASLSALRAELTGLVPDTADTSVAVISDVPTIIAIDDEMLLTIAAGEPETATDHFIWRFNCIGRSLRPGGTRITLIDEVHAIGPKTSRHRTWAFQFAETDLVTINGSEVVRGGYSSERCPDPAETGARMIAKALGWSLPDPDASPAEYGT